jgi:ankyrin repeat protein
VNARKQDYWTPIHLSARNAHFEIVKLLLEHGADVRALTDVGQPPGHANSRWEWDIRKLQILSGNMNAGTYHLTMLSVFSDETLRRN